MIADSGSPLRTALFSDTSAPSRQMGYLWKSKAPTRVLALAWLVLQGSIHTMDNFTIK